MAANNFSASPDQMAVSFHPIGHQIFIHFNLYDIVDLQEWTYTKDFGVRCENHPSAWTLEMTLRRAPGAKLFSGTARLRRRDSMDGSLNVYLELIVNHPCLGIPMTVEVVPNTLAGGTEMLSNIRDDPLIDPGVCHGQLIVCITIFIKECHTQS